MAAELMLRLFTFERGADGRLVASETMERPIPSMRGSLGSIIGNRGPNAHLFEFSDGVDSAPDTLEAWRAQFKELSADCSASTLLHDVALVLDDGPNDVTRVVERQNKFLADLDACAA